jgi:hypothetical protein
MGDGKPVVGISSISPDALPTARRCVRTSSHASSRPIRTVQKRCAAISVRPTNGQKKLGGLPLHDDLRRVQTMFGGDGRPQPRRGRHRLQFALGGALAYADALAPLRLRGFEEPCDPLGE